MLPRRGDTERCATPEPWRAFCWTRRVSLLACLHSAAAHRTPAPWRSRPAVRLAGVRHTSGWSLAAIRQTRRVAAVPLSDTAARFGVAENDLRAALAASRGRGGCAQAVAAMAVAGSAAAGCVSQCPPPAALAGGSVVAAGPVSWSSDLGGDAAVDSEVPAARGLHRRALAAAALHRGHEGRLVVASNSGCAPLMLAALAGQGHRTLQQSALAHPACPPAALAAALAVSPDEVAEPDTVTAAAANPALPAPLLVASVSRRAAAARRGAAANPSCPPRLLGGDGRRPESERATRSSREPQLPAVLAHGDRLSRGV